MKTCSGCKLEKPIEDFHRAPLNKSLTGRIAKCKPCVKAYQKGYYAVNPKPPSRYKHVPRTFNISKEEVAERLEEQGHRCFLCGRDDAQRALAMDHDHSCCEEGSCGQCVRAFLCHSCNGMLGFAKDRPELLRLGAEYLEWFATTNQKGTK